MSITERPSPPDAYSAESGAATATDPQQNVTARQDDAPPVDAPPVDAPHNDAPPVDARDNDAPPVDARDNDAPPVDARHNDAPPVDAPPVDARHNDARHNDAAPGQPQSVAGDGRTSRAPSDGQLAPDAKADDPVAALWGADLVEGYRTRWQTLQLGFVDDPQAATHDAAQLVDQAVQSLMGALGNQKHSLDEWQAQNRGDTEVLRTALQNYREFLNRLLGM